MRAPLLLAIFVVLSGCFGPDSAPDAPAESPQDVVPASRPSPLPPVVPTETGEPEPCVHPYPCGGEWPGDLDGPFGVLPAENVTVRTADGVDLAGVLWMPAVPEGVRVPVVIEATPYAGQVDPPAWNPSYLDAHDRAGYVFRELLERGYAVAIFNVRGTGESGGCFDFWGKAEQRDTVAMVEWAASEPWSSGRVAMYGLSYKGTTPWQAAVQAPPALKTIVVSGILTDMYLAGFTPQGAPWTAAGAYAIALGSAIGTAPPARAGIDALSVWTHSTIANPCPGTTEKLAEHQKSALSDARDAAWYEERRLARHLGNVTAATLVTAGYEDGTAHLYQEDTIWPALTRAPKHMVLGHWGHRFPTEHIEGSASGDDFRAVQLRWFDYWLKGLGTLPVGTGAVDYETGPGVWRVSSSWPPEDAREEVLHLAGRGLRPEPGSESEAFIATAGFFPETLACERLEERRGEGGLVYVGEPVAIATHLAGNAFAYLRFASSEPGGLVSVSLLRMPTAAECADVLTSSFLLAAGSADLRFHGGGYGGGDFPTRTPTDVRIDLWNTGAELASGERLAVVVHRAHPAFHDGSWRWTPTVTLHETSHVVVPLVTGTLGGGPATSEYPPRPFAAGS